MNLRMKISALLLAAAAAVHAGGRHTVYALDRDAQSAPLAKVLLYQDTAAASADAVPTGSFYAIGGVEPFPIPKPKAVVASDRTWVWWGAAGAVLAAGVAAWMFWSDEGPKDQPQHAIAAF